MTRIEIDLPDGLAASVVGATDEQFALTLARAEQVLGLTQRRAEGRLRKLFAYYFLGTGTVILVVSLVLIVLAALGKSNLGETATATLIGSVAVEFVGMLYLVVRYLFREERLDGNAKE